ncbi:MAG: hypothetical protein NDI75_03835, partial [Candidatus Didemnitutus sp.]|nr:hypothetical protein [Candidatus Didemnitutus sp.]
MRKNKTNRTLLTLGALAALVLNSHAAVVVDERFADGNRNGNNPPASLQWYASHTTGILTATTGSMTLQSVGSDGNAARAVGAHFPSVNMAVGDVLLLTFNFRCDGMLGD